MAKNNTRLELTWIGKENRPLLEPRILIEAQEKSYHAKFQTPRGSAGKPWRYLLIPHDQIQDQMTLAGLAARYEMKSAGK